MTTTEDQQVQAPQTQQQQTPEPEKQPALQAVHDPPQFSIADQWKNRADYGIDDGQALNFLDHVEFVSLGCYCATAVALQSLGLKRFTYPFDWCRSPQDGVIHCIENSFEDFLTYTNVKKDGELDVYTGARWGGSFWHHDPKQDDTRDDMTRRAQRLFGLEEVPADKSRVFVRVLNSTRELDGVVLLHKTLNRMNPKCAFRLLLIVDNQSTKGPIFARESDASCMLFYKINKDDWAQDLSDVNKRAMLYAEAVGFAIRFFANVEGAVAEAQMVEDIAEVSAACEHFEGGDPASELFRPLSYHGQRISMTNNAPGRFPLLIGERIGDLKLPSEYVPGSTIQIRAFGILVNLTPPKGSVPGHMVKLRMLDGSITASYLSIATVVSTVSNDAPAAVSGTMAGQALILPGGT